MRYSCILDLTQSSVPGVKLIYIIIIIIIIIEYLHTRFYPTKYTSLHGKEQQLSDAQGSNLLYQNKPRYTTKI